MAIKVNVVTSKGFSTKNLAAGLLESEYLISSSSTYVLNAPGAVIGFEGTNLVTQDGTNRLIGGKVSSITVFTQELGNREAALKIVFDAPVSAAAIGKMIDSSQAEDVRACINFFKSLKQGQLIVGGGGSDDLRVLDEDQNAKADTLDGGRGQDILQGDNGHDVLNGGAGNDRLININGDSLVLPGIKKTGIFDGGAGVDWLTLYDVTSEFLGWRIDLAKTGLQDTRQGLQKIVNIENINGGGEADIIFGNDVNNILRGDGGLLGQFTASDYLDGRGGSDRLEGEDGTDVLIGGDGNDTVLGGQREDTLNGGDGNDKLDGGTQADTVSGGNGNDLLLGGVDELFTPNPDRLSGGNGNDTARGGDGDDNIKGENGNDVLSGENDNDIMFGGAGKDKISGGLGDDTSRGGAGEDTIHGGAQRDALFGEGGADSISGADGDDFLRGGSENDSVDGGIGTDHIEGEAGDDRLDGGGDGDDITGDDGNDTVLGRDGEDFLNGGANNDLITGGDDNDTIIGGTGDDLMGGGDGFDRFDFGPGSGNDTIAGFGDDADKLRFTGGTSFGDLTFTGQGTAQVTVTTANGDTIILNAIPGETITITADDCIF